MSPGSSAVLAADLLDGGLDAEAHRAHEERQARRLREQAHVAVVERDREVEHLVDDRRERVRISARFICSAAELRPWRITSVVIGIGVRGTALAAQSCAVDDRLAEHLRLPSCRASRGCRRRRDGRGTRHRGRSSRSPRARSPGPRARRRRSRARSTSANGSRSPRVNDHASTVPPTARCVRAAAGCSAARRGSARADRRPQRDDLDLLVHHVPERAVVLGGERVADLRRRPPTMRPPSPGTAIVSVCSWPT